jgi:hypothetical protein
MYHFVSSIDLKAILQIRSLFAKVHLVSGGSGAVLERVC